MEPLEIGLKRFKGACDLNLYVLKRFHKVTSIRQGYRQSCPACRILSPHSPKPPLWQRSGACVCLGWKFRGGFWSM